MVSKSEIHFKSVYPNGVTRLDNTQPLITPRINQNTEIINRKKDLLLNKYTSARDANTINALYKYAMVCAVTKLHADQKLLLEKSSMRNTIANAMIAWTTRE